jgi:hypothetical protein
MTLIEIRELESQKDKKYSVQLLVNGLDTAAREVFYTARNVLNCKRFLV